MIKVKKINILILTVVFAVIGLTIYFFVADNDKNLYRELLELEQKRGWKLLYSNGTATLYYLSINGKSTLTLGKKTDEFIAKTYPSLSYQGEKVVFSATSLNPEKGESLIVSSLDSDISKRLTEGRSISNINWSPDGEEIAYLQSEWISNQEEWQLKIINMEGDVKNITNDVAFYSRPSWSPDVQKIAFTSKDGFITILNLETGEFKKLTKGDFPSWSPNQKILYREYKGDKSYWREDLGNGGYEDHFAEGSNYYMIDPDGKNKQFFFDGGTKFKDYLTLWAGLRNPRDIWGNMTFSPDGKFVLFTQLYGSVAGFDMNVYIIKIETGKKIKIATINETLGNISWIETK